MSFNLVLQVIGFIILIIAAILLRIIIQRVRFYRSLKAPGMVDVTERQISYLGPMYGKTISLDNLNKIELRESEAYSAIWVLHNNEGDPMLVPISAKGSERLFDVFSGLPNVKMEHFVEVLNHTPIRSQIVWVRK